MSDSKKKAAENKEAKKAAVEKEEEGIKVINENGVLRIEEGDNYVEGKAKLSFGLKRKIKSLSTPEKMTVKGEDDPVTMHMSKDYKANEDTDLYILDKTLTEWSSKEKVSWKNIQDEVELVDLLEKYVDEFKEINGLKKKKKADDDEKN